jgi:uncharacterized protein YndB with AHSA1/START domain
MTKTEGDEMSTQANSNTDRRHDYGVLERGGPQPLLRYERSLAHPPEKVWRALTERQHLAAWFPTTIEGERVAGARLQFAFEEEMKIEPMLGEMLRFEPPSLLEFSWGSDTVRFELSPAGDGTVLVLSVGLEELGKAARDGAGWHTCLDALALELAGEPDRASMSTRWREVHRVYVSSFGDDAATVGVPQEWEDAHGAA